MHGEDVAKNYCEVLSRFETCSSGSFLSLGDPRNLCHAWRSNTSFQAVFDKASDQALSMGVHGAFAILNISTDSLSLSNLLVISINYSASAYPWNTDESRGNLRQRLFRRGLFLLL